MGADIVEGAQHVIGTARDQDRGVGDLNRSDDEAPGLGQLAEVADLEPVPPEDRSDLKVVVGRLVVGAGRDGLDPQASGWVGSGRWIFANVRHLSSPVRGAKIRRYVA